MEINITNVQSVVRLAKKVNCQNYVLISEVAKEMGVKKTQLMLFIEENPKLFSLCEVKKGDKVLGLGIYTVYTDANQNPVTEEWMKVQKSKWERKLHVGEWSYYGVREFLYFPTEDPKSRESQYRNTPEKFQELEAAGILKRTAQGYGSFGDYSKVEVYLCNGEILKKLTDAGWKTDYDEIKQQ
jgi:hypothetical protein